MTETLSIRIDSETKKRLDALSKSSKRSKSFLAAEAITAYVATEEWQLGEIQAGIADLDSGAHVIAFQVDGFLSRGTFGRNGFHSWPRSRTGTSYRIEILAYADGALGAVRARGENVARDFARPKSRLCCTAVDPRQNRA